MMRASGSRIGRIVIAGSGFEAWLTAGTLAKHLDGRAVDITVVAIPGSESWDDLYSILPLHPSDAVWALGISDAELVGHHAGSFSLGARISGGNLRNEQQFKPYGPSGVDYGGALFHHYWLRDSGGDSVSDYFRYSPGARAMRKCVYAPPAKRNAIGPLQHEIARHVDPHLLTRRLREAATALGVHESMAPFKEVQLSADSKRIERLIATSGEKADADLFIDCSGPMQALLKHVDRIEWLAAPLADEYAVSLDADTNDAEIMPWHSVTPTSDGWDVVIPRGAGELYARFTVDEDDPQPFVPGHLSRPWVHNCVALGHAAFAVLPIEPLQTLQLMASIDRLVALLPGPDTLPSETLEFNQLFSRDLAEVHDLMALHQLARLHGTIDPGQLGGVALPDTLERRLGLFAKRGWVSKSDSDLIPHHTWSAAFLFYGLVPNQHDHLAERIPADVLETSLKELSEQIDKVVSEFPPLGAYLDAAKGATA